MKPYLAFSALAALVPHAAAQQPAAKPHPADASAPVPTAKYESIFNGYRGFRDEPLAPWREVNGDIARAGGAGHGTARPTPKRPPPDATPSPKTQSKPAQHDVGHR